MFGGPRQSLSDVYEDVPDVGEDVLAYLKRELDNSSATTSNHSSASSKASNVQHNDSEKANHELSELAKSMIDGLFGMDANNAKNGEISDIAAKFDQVRSALSKMSFGADRQNLAADAMIEMIKTLGAEDLFASSSEEETA
uniref:Uncharacterized protein n=1 Tax=Parascaris equorum TaxID=6256 RepID=A0A914S9I1_PAREQ